MQQSTVKQTNDVQIGDTVKTPSGYVGELRIVEATKAGYDLAHVWIDGKKPKIAIVPAWMLSKVAVQLSFEG